MNIELTPGYVYDVPGFGKMTLLQIETGSYYAKDVYWGRRATLTFDNGIAQVKMQYSTLVDLLADQQARKLFDDGYCCISGKHLKVARERLRLTTTSTADTLRTWAELAPHLVDVKVVDVDTYVALKKLRRQAEKAPLDVTRYSTRIFQPIHARCAADVSKDEALRPVLYRTEVKIEKTPETERFLRDVLAFRPKTIGDKARERYRQSIEALPDGLYKRTQLRLLSLPDKVKRDRAACAKAFDREVKKYLAEQLDRRVSEALSLVQQRTNSSVRLVAADHITAIIKADRPF
jgi:hypothetical protein